MEITQQPSHNQQHSQNNVEFLPYEVPAVIYEGQITTRAGSPTGSTDRDSAVDPADLFGN